MKKFVAIICAVIIFIFGLSAVYYRNTHLYPQGVTYNYFESANGAVILLNLKDYIAQRNGNVLELYDKDSGQTKALAQNVFDIEKKGLLLLLGARGNTLYYVCTDPENLCVTYYSFNVDFCQRRVIHTDSTLSRADGFLGIDKMLGLTLVSNNSMELMGQAGNIWINNSGVHNAKETKEYLEQYDADDMYGLYDSMRKFAVTDNEIYFINYYNELIRFDCTEKVFSKLPVFPVSDFFITDCGVYYLSDSVLYYTADENEPKMVLDSSVRSVKITDNAVFVLDDDGALFQLNGTDAVLRNKVEADVFSVDEEYLFELNNNVLSKSKNIN